LAIRILVIVLLITFIYFLGLAKNGIRKNRESYMWNDFDNSSNIIYANKNLDEIVEIDFDAGDSDNF
jgi:hypothetical protein